jgi:oleate hydratase
MPPIPGANGRVQLLGVDRNIPPVTPHDKALGTEIEALIKAFE